jgi:Flp pilus assembly protein TadD
LLNLALLVAPVALWVVLVGFGELRRRLGEPGVGFLCTQCVSAGIAALLIDPKLGGARDWDFLAGQSGGILLLGAVLLLGCPQTEAVVSGRASAAAGAPAPAANGRRSPDRAVAFLGTAFLLTLPWVLVLHSPEAGVRRLVDTAPGFPPFARAGAFEEVARYYRDGAGDPALSGAARAELNQRSEAMYRRAVEAYPANPRFHILLASMLSADGKQAESEREYLAALERGAGNANVEGMCHEMLGKIALTRRDYSSALNWFHKLVAGHGTQAAAWELLGYAAVGAGRTDEAAQAFRRAMELDPSRPLQTELGVALSRLGRWQESAEALRRAVRAGQVEPRTRLALAFSLVGQARDSHAADERASLLNEAEEQARAVLAAERENKTAEAALDSVAAMKKAGPPG